VSIKFLADASLHHAIVTGLRQREPSIDFLSANEARLQGLDDQHVLALAAAEGRILVSSDRKTMPEEFGQFLEDRESSPGVFLISQKLPIATAIESLLLIWAASAPAEWENRVCSIPL
jgi:hypothetical protein